MILEKKKTIILTILLDEAAQYFFDAKRKQYFPAYANFTNAHLTLLHCLPNKEIVFEKLKTIAASISTFKLEVKEIVQNKNFNGYAINSDELARLHKTLQNDFVGMLSLKDLKPLKPHITIQNKITEYKAQKTHQILLEDFKPFTTDALGISCWYYTKNKWEKQADYLFTL
jgi:2'-5' RNA ligase